MKTKTCTKCGEVKSLDSFRRSYKTKVSLRSHCRQCENNARVIRLAKDPTKEIDRKAAWAIAHKEQEAAKRRARKLEDPEKYKALAAARPKRDAETSREISKRAIQRLSRSYCASLLEVHVAECPPELIALKREQLQLHRLTKQLNQAIKDAQK